MYAWMGASCFVIIVMSEWRLPSFLRLERETGTSMKMSALGWNQSKTKESHTWTALLGSMGRKEKVVGFSYCWSCGKGVMLPHSNHLQEFVKGVLDSRQKMNCTFQIKNKTKSVMGHKIPVWSSSTMNVGTKKQDWPVFFVTVWSHRENKVKHIPSIVICEAYYLRHLWSRC